MKVSQAPWGLRRYILGVALFAMSLAALAWQTGAPPHVVDPRLLLILGLIAAASALVPVRFVHAGQIQGFTLEGGAVVALLLSGLGWLTPALVMGLSAVVHALRSRDPVKTAFNTGRSGSEAGVATVIFILLAPSTPAVNDSQSVLAVLAALAGFEVTSVLLTTELMARLGQSRRLETLGGVREVWLTTLVGNLGYGILLATVVSVQVWVGLLAGLLMLVIYLGYRGYAAAISGERRARALNRMTHHLIDLPAGGESLGDVLRKLVAVFGAERGVLVVETEGGVGEWRVDHDDVVAMSRDTHARSGVLAAAMARGHGIVETDDDSGGECVAAPISRKGEPVGAIMMAGRRGVEPWGEADASLLAAVANELAVALDNVELLHQVEEERARLEAESTKLNDILTAATDGIVSVRSDGAIEAWNPGMARISGVPAELAVGQPWHAVLRIKERSGAELAPTGDHVISRALAGDRAEGQLSLQILRADGVWRWIDCTSSPVRNHDGTPRGVVVVARDVTAERELDELKSDFIATVSHELRTPLTPLKGFLATLQQNGPTLSEEQLGSVHRAMGTQLSRLETLISDLLAVAELDHGQFELRPEPLPVSDLVADAVEVEAGPELSRCSVLVEPDVTAVADSVAFVRIVRSLVSNAIKHTAGHVEVTARTVDDHIEVAVRDAGPGIAPWDQQRVFNRFERLGNHLTRTQGPGLGLTIARSLALRMGGDIALTSDVGQGATFTLRLPRARPRPVPLRLATEA